MVRPDGDFSGAQIPPVYKSADGCASNRGMAQRYTSLEAWWKV